MAPISRRKLVLESAKMLSPTVRSLWFRTANGAPFAFVSGQWVNLYVEAADELLDRSYSIANAYDPRAPSVLEFAVTLVEDGPTSKALHALLPGAEVEMGGPFGFFTLTHAPPDAPILFVGTGTGVTPLRAMIHDELRRAPASGPALTLLFGCRTEHDILYRDELEALAAAHPRFAYRYTLSRPEDGYAGLRGYVQGHLAGYCADPRTHVYVCGLSKMVTEVRRILKEEHAYDRKRIHTERYD